MTKFSHVPSQNLKETLISEDSTQNDNFDDSLFEDMYDPNNLANSKVLPAIANIFQDNKEPTPIKVDEKHSDRFLILMLYSLNCIINSMAQVTFVPIHEKVLFGYNCMRPHEAVSNKMIDFINW